MFFQMFHDYSQLLDPIVTFFGIFCSQIKGFIWVVNDELPFIKRLDLCDEEQFNASFWFAVSVLEKKVIVYQCAGGEYTGSLSK